MNQNKFASWIKTSFAALGLSAIAAGSAYGQTYLTAVVNNSGGGQSLWTVNAGSVGIINSTSVYPGGNATPTVTGLTSGDSLVGIDWWGNTLYGIGKAGYLYTLNPASGAVVNTFSLGGSLSGTYYGVDATASGIRVVSDQNVNLLVSYSGGTPTSLNTLQPGGTSLGISAIADYNGTFYAINKDSSGLGYLDILNANGSVTSLGSLGVQISRVNGFDINPNTGIAYFVSEVSSGGGSPQLYTVNLGNGSATLQGAFSLDNAEPVSGLAVSPVPEPATTTLALLGGAGLFALIRRRK